MTKKHFDDGIHQISSQEYHESSGYSRSQLNSLLKSPKQFFYELRRKKEETSAMRIGTAVHMMVLEPERAVHEVLLEPIVNKRTKDGRAEYALFRETNKDAVVLSVDEFEKATEMANALNLELSSVFTPNFVKEGRVEQSIYFTEPGGIQLKARPDLFNKGIVVDIKTTRNASYRAFQSAAVEEGYFLQAAMQRIALLSSGEEFLKFIFVCVENVEPYNTAVYMVDDEALAFGLSQLEKCITKLEACLDSDSVESLGIQTLTAPYWALA